MIMNNDFTLMLYNNTIKNIDNCVNIIENEKNVLKIMKYIKVIDENFGVTTASTTDDLMRNAIQSENRDLIVLSGYAHLLLAEQMKKQQYDIDDINIEINKAENLLNFANLGGNHPLLPRTMNLKRKVNWKAYIKLAVACFIILLLIIIIGVLYKFIEENEINIL